MHMSSSADGEDHDHRSSDVEGTYRIDRSLPFSCVGFFLKMGMMLVWVGVVLVCKE